MEHRAPVLILAIGVHALLAAEEEQDATRTVPPSPNLSIPHDLPERHRKPLEEAIAALEEAEKAEREGDRALKKAIEKLQAASAKIPKAPLPLYHLGRAYQMRRNFPEARRVLDKALKLNPKFHEAIVELGDVHVWQKDLKGALGVYERALAISPDYPYGLERKAKTLIRLGRFKEAKPYLEQLLKVESNPLRKLIATRLELELKGPGWARTYPKETENYEVLSSVSQAFADSIARHAELIRRAYDQVFSDIPKPDRKYAIWVFEDREAYLKGGGPPMAAGHYDQLFRKLVIYKNPKVEETLITLYHEAFHQYLQDYLDAAPQWFNEGLGDYFGAYLYVKKGSEELMYPRPNVGRLSFVQHAIRLKLCPPASDLMLMSQREMYEPRMVGVHYSQAWAMIYFILEGNKPQYRSVLVNYFKALTKGKNIHEAYQATFGRINMTKFDEEWKGYIASLSGK